MKNKTFIRASLPAVFANLSFFLRHSPSRIALCLVAIAAALLFCNAPSANAEHFVTTGGELEWTNTANWVEGTVPNAIGAAAIFNDPVANATNSLAGSASGGGITVGSLLFDQNINPAPNTITTTITNGADGGPLTFDNGGAGATITTMGTGAAPSLAPFGTLNVITSPMVFKDSMTLTANNISAIFGGGSLSMRGVISGPGGFTKNGDGLAEFRETSGGGPKSYTGATVINAGRMRISTGGAPTNTSSLTVNTGGQLDIISAGTVRFGNGPLTLNGSGSDNPPYNTARGAMRNERGATITNIVILNDVVLQSDTLIHIQSLNNTGEFDSPAGTNTLAGNISGPGRLTFTAPGSNRDAGVLILNGHNTYTGGTLVSGGILDASGASATFGTGDVTVDNEQAPRGLARITIEAGVINAIADTATLSMVSSFSTEIPTARSGFAILGDGVNEVVAALNLDGAPQAFGTYGSTSSSAANKNDVFFRGTGIVTVAVSLTITLAAPNAILSWPTSATGFTLQELAAFSSTTNIWTDVTTPVVISGANNTVTVPASSGNDFFRLKQ